MQPEKKESEKKSGDEGGFRDERLPDQTLSLEEKLNMLQERSFEVSITCFLPQLSIGIVYSHYGSSLHLYFSLFAFFSPRFSFIIQSFLLFIFIRVFFSSLLLLPLTLHST
jgi:hypothetical protein